MTKCQSEKSYQILFPLAMCLDTNKRAFSMGKSAEKIQRAHKLMPFLFLKMVKCISKLYLLQGIDYTDTVDVRPHRVDVMLDIVDLTS